VALDVLSTALPDLAASWSFDVQNVSELVCHVAGVMLFAHAPGQMSISVQT